MKIIVAVLDHAVGAFSVPFFDSSKASALRNFSDAVNDSSNPNNMWHKHPEDYSLYFIGEFDEQKGLLIPLTHEKLVTAASVRTYDKSKLPPEILDTISK